MSKLGLRGVRRGRKVRTTISGNAACPLDLMERNFMADAPNRLLKRPGRVCASRIGAQIHSKEKTMGRVTDSDCDGSDNGAGRSRQKIGEGMIS